jgi:putative ABC transport system substrate-binding protein
MLTRRGVVVAFVGGVLAPLASVAQQQGRIWRVGFLNPALPDSRVLPRLHAFREGMRQFGYVEGRNLRIEARWADGKLHRLPALAAELVALNVDAIIVAQAPAIDAARKATTVIPLVMATSPDPVGEGYVASLARPGGNITGLSMMAPELGGKRIELLKETFPKLSRTLAVIWNPAQKGMRARYEQAQSAAPKLGLAVQSVEVTNLDELREAFDAISKDPPDALVLIADPFTASQRARIVEFAAAKRLPAIYDSGDFVQAGGLMSYGPDQLTQYRRAAYYVDRILRGAKPSDLPIELPTRFEFIINMKAATALGIKFPDSILVQVTKVIE